MLSMGGRQAILKYSSLVRGRACELQNPYGGSEIGINNLPTRPTFGIPLPSGLVLVALVLMLPRPFAECKAAGGSTRQGPQQRSMNLERKPFAADYRELRI
jgi:hypothetical protein